MGDILLGIRRLGEPKISHFGNQFVVEQNVVALDITVKDYGLAPHVQILQSWHTCNIMSSAATLESEFEQSQDIFRSGSLRYTLNSWDTSRYYNTETIAQSYGSVCTLCRVQCNLQPSFPIQKELLLLVTHTCNSPHNLLNIVQSFFTHSYR